MMQTNDPETAEGRGNLDVLGRHYFQLSTLLRASRRLEITGRESLACQMRQGAVTVLERFLSEVRKLIHPQCESTERIST